jgi:D-sedoheptulose 7-phosphate isomerase
MRGGQPPPIPKGGKTLQELIQSYTEQVCTLLHNLPVDAIERAIDLLLQAAQTGHMVYLMGNGGSAATASHMANDLSKGTMVPGAPRFKAISLTDNIPLITAWANDSDYAKIFEAQLEPGDVAIGISGSGNSENVLRAIRLAKARGAHTIGFTGAHGGKLAYLVDVHINAPNAPMEAAEDAHMFLDHLICTTIRALWQRQVHT